MKFEVLTPFRARNKWDIQMVPDYLYEQIERADADVIAAIRSNAETIAKSENVWFVLLIAQNEKLMIKGVLWFNVDVIEHQIFVYLFSVDPEYQSCDMNLVQWIAGYIFGLDEIDGKYRRKISWLTDRPEAFEKFGIKRSKRTMLEISREEYERLVEIRGKDFSCK